VYVDTEPRDKTLIFLHLPRTAGTTLHRIIERQYDPNSIYTIDGVNSEQSCMHFRKIPPHHKTHIKVLKGHMEFGMHEFLPNPATYVTLLRDPIDRIISHYYFVRQNPDHYLYRTVVSGRLTLKGYVSSGLSRELDNGQTRMLSGPTAHVPVGECNDEMLQRAKHNLQSHFSVVGLAEQFDQTLLMLQDAFGWKTPFYVRQNATHRRPARTDVPAEVIDTIRRINRYDVALYDYAATLFEQQRCRLGVGFAARVKLFQSLNRFTGPCAGVHDLTTRAANKFRRRLTA